MEFAILTNKEFDDFVKKEETKNFFQTSMMKEKYSSEKTEVYLVGLKDNNKVVAASMLVCTEIIFGYKTFEALKGFIIDYHNYELVNTFTKEVKKFLQTKKCYRLIIDPYLANISRDTNGDVINGKVDNRDVSAYLSSIGYKYKGEGTQVKWVYCLDIDGKNEQELLSSFSANTRNCINKTISKFNLEIKELTYDELPLFKKITEETCDRKHFSDKPLSYYESMYNHFKDNVKFLICSLNCDSYIENTEKEISSLEEKINKLSSAKANEKKKENMLLDIENYKKRVEETKELKEKYGNVINLSAGMFMLYGSEIIYLFSGSYVEFMNFFGQYRIQWEIIKYASNNKYKRYNFYGIKEFRNKNSKDYGVYQFKKGFNGYVEELLGTFELTINPINYIIKPLKAIKKVIN